jgi:hypothetical protein
VLVLVKQLLPSGVEFIQGGTPFHRRGKFDRFPTHGNGLLSSWLVLSYDGRFASCCYWQLKDGDTFYYLMHISGDFDESVDFLYAWFYFIPTGYPGFAEGEGYNYIARPQTQQKLTEDEFAAQWHW